MMTRANVFLLDLDAIGNKTPDEELVRRVLAGATKDFAVLMRRHNQRLYRVCRSVVANAAEAEAALQEAYLRAYRNLAQFRGGSSVATWLTKIAIYEALARLRPLSAAAHEFAAESSISIWPQLLSKERGVEYQPGKPDSARLLEEAIDSLPPNFRRVFILRQIEELSADETAACLLLSPEAVETRLMRSRRILQDRLRPHVLDQPVEQVFPFQGKRSTELAERVAKRISQRSVDEYSANKPQLTTP